MKIRLAIFVLVGAIGAGCAVNALHNGGREGHVTIHAAMASPQLGIIADENMRVVAVRPNSAAGDAGVQIGDILVALVPLEPDDPDTAANRRPRLVPPDTFTFPQEERPMPPSGDGALDNPAAIPEPPVIPTEAIVMHEEPWDPASEITQTLSFKDDPRKARAKVDANGDRILVLRIQRGDSVINLRIRPRVTKLPDGATPVPYELLIF